MDSIWIKTAVAPRFEPLKGDIKTDVLVIGGGITGILCAYMLKRAGVDVVLVEADRICGGVTKNTTAKLTLQHGLIYDQMIRRFGIERARMYLQAQRRSFDEYRALCRDLDCDWEECDSYVYSLDDAKKIEREVSALEKIGCKASFTAQLPLPFSVAGAVRVAGQAQIHPLKLLYALAKELPIYENTRIHALQPHGALSEGGKIKAEKIIVATHFPFLNKHGAYFLKLYQRRSYVLALKNAPHFAGMYVDEAQTGMSFRHYGDILLLGGGGHRTGKKGGNWQELREFARVHYPEAQEVGQWATQDCMTLDDVPYIGQYGTHTPQLYVATGFGKWGMTNAMTAAMLLSDLVQEKSNDSAAVFSPSRRILRPQLAVNAAHTLVGLLMPTTPRCPHMGCALMYNKQEHSWDCGCHGSRFTEQGQVIDNPATGDKKMPERHGKENKV